MTLFGWHQRNLFPPVCQRLVGFGFRVQCVVNTMQNLRRMGENSDPILSRLWTKVHEIFRRYRKPLVLTSPFPIVCVTFHSQDIRHLVWKSSKNGANAKVLWAPIFVGGTAPTFLRQFVMATYYPFLGKFGWVPFADLRLRSLAMKQNAEFTDGG